MVAVVDIETGPMVDTPIRRPIVKSASKANLAPMSPVAEEKTVTETVTETVTKPVTKPVTKTVTKPVEGTEEKTVVKPVEGTEEKTVVKPVEGQREANRRISEGPATSDKTGKIVQSS